MASSTSTSEELSRVSSWGESTKTTRNLSRVRCCALRATAAVLTVLIIGGGIAAAVYFLVLRPRERASSPSGGYGRPIPPWDVYPGPYDTPIDWSSGRYPATSPLYRVNVSFSFTSNGSLAAAATPAFVYFNSIAHRAQNAGADVQRPGQSVSWAGFSFDSSLVYADVEIHTSFVFTACVLRPLSNGLACDVPPGGGSVARIRIPNSPVKVSVELYSPTVDNSAAFVSQPLFLFPDPPESPALVPSPTDAGVLYYARGVHNLSGQLSIPCGTNNVYLEPGGWPVEGHDSTEVLASLLGVCRGLRQRGLQDHMQRWLSSCGTTGARSFRAALAWRATSFLLLSPDDPVGARNHHRRAVSLALAALRMGSCQHQRRHSKHRRRARPGGFARVSSR